MRVWRFLLRIGKPYRLQFLIIIFASFFITLVNISQIFLLRGIIDAAASLDNTYLLAYCIAFICAQAVNLGAWILFDYAKFYFRAHYRCDIISHFLDHLYHSSYRFFQNYLTGKLTTKVSDIFNNLPRLILTIIIYFLDIGLSIIVALALLMYIQPLLAVVMLGWLLIYFAMIYYFKDKAISITHKYSEVKANMMGYVADYVGNILSVKLFSSREHELHNQNRLKEAFMSTARETETYFNTFYFSKHLLNTIYTSTLLVILIKGFNNGSITLGDLAFIITINFTMIGKLFKLAIIMRDFAIDWGSIDQALSILEVEPEVQDRLAAPPLNLTAGQIKFEQIIFGYPNREKLFNNLSVTIAAGQKVGLVGYSGAGKTTFINLILRLYDIDSGQIAIDDQDIALVTQDSLRSTIGLIPQDPILFHRSLKENIAYGRVDASETELFAAAKSAYIHKFITELPHGYESLVGERGVKLSGGQRQRIAIARAILKNASILILDEATSQLDSVTEQEIQTALWKLMQNKTTIVIAHRLSTLLNMDRILVFQKGQIVEDGTHAELLAKGGLFTELWKAQTGGFLPQSRTDS